MIHKIVAVVIQENKYFMVRKFGKDIWTSLGGGPEKGETEEQALLREIKEEIECDAKIIRKIGDFEGKAVFDEDVVKLSTYLVELRGKINLNDPELEECAFFDKDYKKNGIKISDTVEEQIIPLCIKQGLLKW
jgi:8-oxo-dGTP pyrophosphatase MutT (NUDIX family)